MRKETVRLLKCPSCLKGGFQLDIMEENLIEICQGVLFCPHCNIKFSIEKGIPDLLYNPSKIILDEIEGEQKIVENEGFPYWAQKDALLQMPYYRRHGKDVFGHFHSAEVNFISMVERLDLKPGQLMLDVGTAQCWTSNFFAKKKIRVIATDTNVTPPIGLETAEFFLNENLFFDRIRSDMHVLPFAEESFDYVFFNNVAHHASDIGTVFKACFRVLKTGGKLVLVGEPSGGYFSSSQKFGEKLRSEYHINENLYSFLSYHKALHRSGFKKIKYLFPPAIDLKLSTGKYGWPRVNKKVFRGIYWFWRFRIIRLPLKIILFWPAALLYNFQVNCIVKK